MKSSTQDTIDVLNQFNREFDASKRDLISKFLQDQKELNRRFREYALDSDDERHDVTANVNIHTEQNKQNRDDDECSVDSNLTEYSFSASDDENPKARRDVTKTSKTVTKPVGGATRQLTLKKRVGAQRSQSLRSEQDNASGLQTPRPPDTGRLLPRPPDAASLHRPHAPEPPPRSQAAASDVKPSLNELRLGQQPSANRKQPKKLLIKRAERPRSALGYHSHGDVLNEEAYADENGFRPPDRMRIELHHNKLMELQADSTRSAPVRHPRHVRGTWKNDLARMDEQKPAEASNVFQPICDPNRDVHRELNGDASHSIEHNANTVVRPRRDVTSRRVNSSVSRELKHDPISNHCGGGEVRHDAMHDVRARDMKHDMRYDVNSMNVAGLPAQEHSALAAAASRDSHEPFSRSKAIRKPLPVHKHKFGAVSALGDSTAPHYRTSNARANNQTVLTDFGTSLHKKEHKSPSHLQAQSASMRRFKGQTNLAMNDVSTPSSRLSKLKLPPVTIKRRTYADPDTLGMKCS